MIDIHSHILPSIDDGASSIDESVAMLDAAAALGYRTIVATPHLTGQLTTAYHQRVTTALETLRPMAAARGIDLLGGFEVRLTPDLSTRLRHGEPITLAGGPSILVDLPTGNWAIDLDEALFNIQVSGFQPVLAHPERYVAVQQRPRYGRELADRGVVLQVTIGSFAGIFGKRAKKAAEALLREGAVHVVATDAHSPEHRLAAVPPGLKRIARMVREGDVERLTDSGCMALLNGDNATPAREALSPLRRFIPAIGNPGRS